MADDFIKHAVERNGEDVSNWMFDREHPLDAPARGVFELSLAADDEGIDPEDEGQQFNEQP